MKCSPGIEVNAENGAYQKLDKLSTKAKIEKVASALTLQINIG